MATLTFKSNGYGMNFTAVVLGFLLLLTISLLALWQGSAEAADKELRIGILTSYKMECGQVSVKAAEMAAEELNTQGGVLGRKVRIYSADSEGSPEKGISALKRLVEKEKVHILAGGAISGVVLAAMDYLKRYNIVFM